MEIRHTTRDGCLVVAFTGSIHLASVAQVQRRLLKHLAEQPAALICDPSGVTYLDPVFATVFSTVANHSASRWPTTNLLLCGAQPQVAQALRRVEGSHLVPLYVSVEEALDAALDRPSHLREEWRLAPIPTAAAGARARVRPRGPPGPRDAPARAIVRQLCRTWQLDAPDATVVDRAVLVANELVTNAVVHARTELWLQLELRADRLFIAVRDASPRLLRQLTPDPEAGGGRGLWLVEQLTQAWGVSPHPDGGKVVWCALTL